MCWLVLQPHKYLARGKSFPSFLARLYVIYFIAEMRLGRNRTIAAVVLKGVTAFQLGRGFDCRCGLAPKNYIELDTRPIEYHSQCDPPKIKGDRPNSSLVMILPLKIDYLEGWH